ncbi:hypothetical protein [Aequorivita echinoideorum]|uniref:Uncharacterized protein n=1 Tax=Aequorivita echinoideorum TaxID=1549647 RepID=A0ABS5S350_9FLAO|nr:hypothetical protein [Aequorivita echinoideorum]MBT0607642.1 hypothetical protein [Aequorivita echinoideorum]
MATQHSQHLYFGKGGTTAVHFSDSKESHTVIKPEEKGNNKIALWGDDNRYPQNFLETLRKNGAGGTSYRLMKAAHYGQGFRLNRTDQTDDGKEDKSVVPLSSQPDILHFFNRSKMPRVWTEVINNLETWNIAFPEYILSNDFSKVVSLRNQPTAKMRYELINPKTGLIENAYFCHNWQSGTDVKSEYVQKIPVVDIYASAEEIKEYCKKNKFHKFVMPIFYPMLDEIYYPEADHHSVYKNGWMEVVNNIPDFKKSYAKNQLNIKFMVYISDEYFVKTYGDDWQKYTLDKKKEIRQALSDAIDNHLSGNANAGKSIQTTVFKDREGKWVKGIEVVPLETKTNSDGTMLLDASGGNAEIMGAIGADPVLMGVGIPGNKLNGNGGSNKREALSILNALMKTKRETTLEIWRTLRDYNGWDATLEGDFAVTELTTLDKNPTGTENKF